MHDCEVNGSNCHVQQVLFDDVVIDTLRIGTVLNLLGCAFRHVTLRGPIDAVMTTPPHRSIPAPARERIIAGTVALYQDVDWALDISEAEFTEATFYYVPGHLVRRDPDTQFLLHRAAFADVDRADMPSYAAIAASRFESTPFDSIVAVAATRAPDAARRLEELTWLRERGLAE